jgi:hypothetical protein
VNETERKPLPSYSLVSDQHRPLASFDKRDERTRFCNLRRLVDQDRVKVDLAQRSQPSACTRRERDARCVDALLRLSMQAIVFMEVSANPRVDRVALKRFVDFGLVGGNAEDEVVREESMFFVQFKETLQDVVDG